MNVRIAPVLPKLPARTEMLASNVMVDGAHNENGANALEKSLPHKNITAVVGMMADKDYDSYLRIIAPHCKKNYRNNAVQFPRFACRKACRGGKKILRRCVRSFKSEKSIATCA